MYIPKYWCGAPLSILIGKSLLDSGWSIQTKTGSKRLGIGDFKNFYERRILQDFGINEQFANAAEIDVFAHRNKIYLCIEIKTRLYARIRAKTHDYQIPYDSLHSRYHFDRYPEAVDALLRLKERPTLADDKHETIRSSCELIRYCLGLVQAKYTNKSCFIAVLMPFYAKEVEFETTKECLDRLRSYVVEKCNFDIPMAVWKVNVGSLCDEVPSDLWIENLYQQNGFNISPPRITNGQIQDSLMHWRKYKHWKRCEECKYRKFCERTLRGY